MIKDYTLRTDADVEVIKRLDKKHRPLAAITIDGEFEHVFPHTSRVSRHLDSMSTEDLQDRLTGGSYFLVEGELVDFRDSSYHGFVHDTKTIDTFMDILGYQRKDELKMVHMQKNQQDDDVHSPIVLRKVWNEGEINVPGYAQGTDFNSLLSFQWNPFMKNVNTMLDIVRLICTNGMVGITSFLNTKVPVMNRWEEHLDIASRQIQNKVNDIVIQRIGQMVHENCSLADLLLLEDHITTRMSSSIDQSEYRTLSSMINAVSPRLQLSHVYRESTFDDKNLAAQLPGHLSLFDAFNIATQVRTHVAETAKSSDFALDKFANGILFDRERANYNATAKFKPHDQKAFQNPEQAFWGIAA